MKYLPEKITTDWQMFTASGGMCVEVKREGDNIFIRETLDSSVVVQTNVQNFSVFALGIKLGKFDDLCDFSPLLTDGVGVVTNTYT